jgi:membrane protein DedA with SNARE-associated domain
LFATTIVYSKDVPLAELINQITLLGERALYLLGYPGIFLVVFVENFVGPLPMPPVLPLSGIMAARGSLNFFGVWFAAVAGALAGALALYAFGVWVDERVVRQLIRRYGRWLRLSEANFDRALRLFQRYGAPAIIVGRLLPVMRNLVSLTAGMSRVPLPRFIFCTLVVSGPTIGLWVYGGYLLGENWRDLLRLITVFEPVIVVGIGVALTTAALFLLFRLIRYLNRGMETD